MKKGVKLFALLAAGLIVAGCLWYYLQDEDESEVEEVGEYAVMTITPLGGGKGE